MGRVPLKDRLRQRLRYGSAPRAASYEKAIESTACNWTQPGADQKELRPSRPATSWMSWRNSRATCASTRQRCEGWATRLWLQAMRTRSLNLSDRMILRVDKL